MKCQKFKRGQMWWYASSGGIGDRQNILEAKTRPYLIISNDLANVYSDYLLAIPCTTAAKKDLVTHVSFISPDDKQTTVLCENTSCIKKEFLLDYIGTLDDELLKKVETALQIALGIITDYEVPVKAEQVVISETVVTEVEPQVKSTRGRKKLTKEDRQRFIADYENHDKSYMLKKYNIPTISALYRRVEYYKKAMRENS